MKILYIAMKYDYGDPARGLSFEHYNFYDSLVKMDGGKHKIIYFPFDEAMREADKETMNQKLIETANTEKPDLIFFCLFTDEIDKKTIRTLSKDFVTYNWFLDDTWRFWNFSRHWAPYFRWVSTTDSFAPEQYRRSGYYDVIKTQYACNHFLYKPGGQLPPNKYDYEVSFVGQPHGNRKKIVGNMTAEKIPIETWGSGWENGRISQEKMMDIFYKSRINLNLTKSSGGLNIKNIAKIFLGKYSGGGIHIQNPKLWVDNIFSLIHKSKEQIKGRNFEIPGCGGFLLTADADNLWDYYENGKEIVIFKDEKDLIEKIQYYLLHDSEREAIAKRGYERTLREHTYEKRFNDIFKIING